MWSCVVECSAVGKVRCVRLISINWLSIVVNEKVRLTFNLLSIFISGINSGKIG